MITYNEFIDFIDSIVEGDDQENVRAKLGDPTLVSGSDWIYKTENLKGYPGVPSPVAVTVFTEFILEFEKEEVKRITRGWFDATGSRL